MPGPSIPFSEAEYARRLDKTRRAMAAHGVEVLFVSDPANMAWLTGYDGWSFYVFQGVILTGDGPPLWWGRAQDANGALRTVWMLDEAVLSYAEDYIQSTTQHPMQDLAEVLIRLGHAGAAIGVEADRPYFTGKALDTLRADLPNARIVDATGLVNWQRAVKSEEELVFMRRAGRLAEYIVANVLQRVEPGLRKNELVAEIYRDALRGVDGLWGDYPAIVPLLPSGEDAAAPHLTWDGRELSRGEATFFELAGCYRRYHAPFCRTVFLGTPPNDMRAAEGALRDGLEAGLQAAVAGNRAGDIARALKSELRKAGIERAGRVGYSIGLAYPPDWGEGTISIREGDDTVLEPGMCFHFMPGIWSKGWGLESTESLVIAESGAPECLASAPRELVVKG